MNAVATLNNWPVYLLFCLVLCSGSIRAEQPAEFNISYAARYGNWLAQSERRLIYDAATATYNLRAQSKVLLLGTSVTTITETATFGWQGALPLPREYEYEQEGIGRRKRSISFDQKAASATTQVNDASVTIPLLASTYDDLTAFLVIKQQLQDAASEIYFDVLDRDNVKTYHYRVLDEDFLHTELGDFAAVHLERIRDENSKRSTEFWLAMDYEYLLLKLLQEEPNGRILQLEINAATLAGKPLKPLKELHMNELGE